MMTDEEIKECSDSVLFNEYWNSALNLAGASIKSFHVKQITRYSFDLGEYIVKLDKERLNRQN